MMPLEKWHYTEEVRSRYHTSNCKIKKQILDEFCAVCGYSRKHAIVLFNKGSVEVKKTPQVRSYITTHKSF